MLLFIPVGDIAYTNWGVTNSVLEPLEDSSKKCIKVCMDENNSECDGKWKVEDCNSPLNYICQLSCKTNTCQKSSQFSQVIL